MRESVPNDFNSPFRAADTESMRSWPPGGLLITVVLVFLFLVCLEMPGHLKLLAVAALALNVRWWWFVEKTAPRDPPNPRD
jgi:hypothetical protein